MCVCIFLSACVDNVRLLVRVCWYACAYANICAAWSGRIYSLHSFSLVHVLVCACVYVFMCLCEYDVCTHK